MKKNEAWKYILKIIIGILLLSIIPTTLLLQEGVNKLKKHERFMLTSDNPVNTIKEALQYDKMTDTDKYNVCMQLLEPVREHYQDYNQCVMEINAHGYIYTLYRNGNVAKGTIRDRYFVTYPVYCEKTDDGTFIRVFKDGTWYEEKIKDENVIEINADFFENLIKNTNWDTAFVSDNEIYKPTPETNIVCLSQLKGIEQKPIPCIAINPCKHMYVVKDDKITVYFLAIGYSDINIPHIDDFPVIPIDDVYTLFNEEGYE
ncbi:MAG: hypothetical protein IJ419_13850 [Agathobacter sp.]|nr:hypothetical protein [Agathobacter sp.]